ncbi:MAG TPA: Bax inhibitor-1 family protein [Spirochaetia bacterium]|nr:Bax inhibitor-1 family protein [Spirochaetia bacterium]
MAFAGGYDSQTVARPVGLSQVMGILSFMFLAMAAGAFLVPASLYVPALIVEFALLFIMPVMARRDRARGKSVSSGTAGALALVFASAAGAVLAPLVQSLDQTTAGTTLLAEAAVITFTVFALFGLYGLTTRRNLSGLGRVLFIALLALVGIMVLSLFFSQFFSPFGLLIGLGGAGVFALLTAVDFQRAKYAGADDAVMVAVSIFLDFINLFVFILDILMIFGGGGLSRRR